MKTVIRISFFIAFCLALAIPAIAQDEVNHLDIGERLLRDGRYKKAEESLNKVVTKELEDEDRPRYFTLWGLLNLKSEKFDLAISNFERALKSGQKDEQTYLFLAQCHLQKQSLDKALAAVERVQNPVVRNTPKFFLLKYRILDDLQRPIAGYGVLLEAREKIPTNRKIMINLGDFLLSRGLLQESLEQFHHYLDREGVHASDYLTVSSLLRKYKFTDAALKIVTIAKLRFPVIPEVLLEMAILQAEKEKVFSAYLTMMDLAYQTGDYNKEAAELSARVGYLHQSFLFNAKVQDQKEKLKQRLSLHLESEDFDSVLAMQETLNRWELMQDDHILYSMAYALFRKSQYQKTHEMLSRIQSSKFFSKANLLRKAILDCEEHPEGCL